MVRRKSEQCSPASRQAGAVFHGTSDTEIIACIVTRERLSTPSIEDALSAAIAGKRVVLVDDSIVRGTTSGRIVSLLREAGAREIHFRVSAPPFLNPCYYGTDIDSRDNLIACHHTVEEIAQIIGVDSLGYLPVEQLGVLIGKERCCDACFTGCYPTPIPTDTRKDRFERKLSEKRS